VTCWIIVDLVMAVTFDLLTSKNQSLVFVWKSMKMVNVMKFAKWLTKY